MNSMRNYVGWAILLYFLTVSCWCISINTVQYEKLSQYSDIFISGSALWERKVESIYTCAVLCSYETVCISFFLNNVNCVGYDQAFPTPGDIIPLLGNEFWHIKGLPSGATTENIQPETTIQNIDTTTETTKLETTISNIDTTTEAIQPETTINDLTTVDASTWCTGDRFVFGNGKCYKAWTSQLSWDDAQATCQGEGGQLAILDTIDKINLMATIPDYHCLPGKLGPFINKCYQTTSTLKTRNDSGIECTSGGGMLASFPDSSTYNIVINGTGILHSSDTWWLGVNDIGPNEAVMKTFDNQPIPWDNIVYPYGWFDRDCVIISPTDNYQWIEADCLESHKAVCEYPLVTDYWIGGHDRTVEGDWRWTDLSAMDMTKWYSTQPNGGSIENCAVLKYVVGQTLFADEDCSQTREFICERSLA